MNYPNPGSQGQWLNTITFPELYDIVDKTFVTLMAMAPQNAEQLFIVDTVSLPHPAAIRFDEYDVETFASRKPEAVGTTAASIAIGYSKTLVPLRFGKKIVVTKEDRIHNRYQKVQGDMQSLSHFVPQRKERDLTHVITFGTATSYTNAEGETITTTMGDGLALFSTVHTLKHSSLTYSNRVTGDPLFSKGALEAAETLGTTDILSNFGEKRRMSFNKLYTTDYPSVCNAVRRMFGSSTDDTQNNSGVMNVNKSKYVHVELPWLATDAAGAQDSTKKNWWGIVATGPGQLGARWQAYLTWFEKPYLVSAEEGNTKNGDTDVWEMHTRGYYLVGAVSGRGIVGSCPTS